MANRTILTSYARAFFPHLAEPHAHDDKQEPKYSVVLGFRKDGQLPAHLANGQQSDCGNIMQALEEVCQEEWQVPYAQAAQTMGVKFPPEWKNGDEDWKKDDNGRILVGQPREASVGMWMLSVKSLDPVGCVDHTGNNEISPREVYPGCWIRAELEVSAYKNKAGSHIIAISLCNVQKCYDDESLGGGAPRRAATAAFSGMAVQGSNCQIGAGQSFAQQPGQASAPAMPGQTPAPTPQPAAPQLTPVPGAQYTIEQCRAANWTDEQIVQAGYATLQQAQPAPGNGPAPATAGAPQPQLPGAPGAANTPNVPNVGAVGAPPVPAGNNMPGQAPNSPYLNPAQPGNAPAMPGMPQ